MNTATMNAAKEYKLQLSGDAKGFIKGLGGEPRWPESFVTRDNTWGTFGVGTQNGLGKSARSGCHMIHLVKQGDADATLQYTKQKSVLMIGNNQHSLPTNRETRPFQIFEILLHHWLGPETRICFQGRLGFGSGLLERLNMRFMDQFGNDDDESDESDEDEPGCDYHHGVLPATVVYPYFLAFYKYQNKSIIHDKKSIRNRGLQGGEDAYKVIKVMLEREPSRANTPTYVYDQYKTRPITPVFSSVSKAKNFVKANNLKYTGDGRVLLTSCTFDESILKN